MTHNPESYKQLETYQKVDAIKKAGQYGGAFRTMAEFAGLTAEEAILTTLDSDELTDRLLAQTEEYKAISPVVKVLTAFFDKTGSDHPMLDKMPENVQAAYAKRKEAAVKKTTKGVREEALLEAFIKAK